MSLTPNESLHLRSDYPGDDCLRYIAEIKLLRAKLAEAEKDVERYRWLRSRIPGSAYRIIGITYSEGGEGVDTQIDTAIAKHKASMGEK